MSALIFLVSCIQSPSSSRKSLLSSSATTGSKTSTTLPTFTEGNNFIQNGGVIYSSVVSFDLSYVDTLQLRGKDVDSYIRNNGTQTISCLTGRFTATTVNQVNIIAAIPHSVYNFTTNSLEYYYSIAPSDSVSNKNFCQKSGLVNKLFLLYSGLTPTYAMKELCPGGNCVSSTYTSQSLELYTQGGNAITQVATKQLTYSIKNNPVITTPIGQTCVTNSECVGKNYDCCSLGQCVKDLALKQNVTTSSPDYVQALQDILNNPSHIYNYPQYYYLCSSAVNTPGGTTTPTNPNNEAAVRLKNLGDLYNCTTKLEGEMGICTVTIPNALPNVVYSAGADDRSFSTTYTNQASSDYTPTLPEELISIQEVTYGEVTLFNYDQIALDSSVRPSPYLVSNYLTINGHHNDNTTTGATITLLPPVPTSAVSHDLVIRYRNDASCTQLSSTLAKCEKYYVQGQQKKGDTLAQYRRGRATDHYPSSNIFALPYYANTSKTITVEVDGVNLTQDVDWKLNATSPANIQFFPSASGGLRVFDTQKVKINYFVDLSVNHVMDSKIAALGEIKAKCSCADLNCGLAPVTNSAGIVTDYTCVYPDPNPVAPPSTQTVYLSSKTVPVRYFDSAGVSQSVVTGSTKAQEGNIFSYIKDNLLAPNNMPDPANPVAGEYYVGFNEIYGSLSYANNSAKAAKEINVGNGKTYDIYVDSGTYSNCVQCGNDYYSQLNKLFPLTQFGGGTLPLQSRTDRTQANGIRADDMAFGRACLVPATMIPWTHAIASSSKEQRLNRLSAQHFLYANGYQHDWYGFDYGAVIGSFDGVKWFAIGTNRRIKANSTKLFLAVNGPFGDLALESTFTVTINDSSLNPVGSNMVTSDIESDGAQCQKFYQCSTDNDCATTLGWDYTCANVNEITTSWPRFDANAKEIPDAMRDDNKLVSILGMSSSGKRCVYRGRGAACTPNYLSSAINLNSTFNQTQIQSMHTCSANNYCQTIATNSSMNPNFNNRIARYGKVRTDSTTDSFGLAAKVPGRPMEFNASESIKSTTARNFNSNKLTSLCVPGRSPESTTFIGQNSTVPAPEYTGDKILGIGMTFRKDTTMDSTYLAACSVMDESKNYYYAKSDTPNAANSTNLELIRNSASQSISTNALAKFKSIFEATKKISFPIYTNNSTTLNSLTFTENRCMRAPGASCFSDLDCAPSKAITDKVKMLSADDTTITAILNKYEIKFWQEELVCSQSTPKSDATYSAFNNRCCREVGKVISLPSANDDIAGNASALPISMDKIPGVDIDMASKFRYSRVATVYKDQKNDPTNYPQLKAPIKDQCNTGPAGTCVDTTVLTNQFKTFAAYAERTSCTSDWIRNFSNGNHIWDRTRFQTFAPAMFRCMNWLPGNNNWTCAGLEQDDPSCSMIQTSPYSGKAKAVMAYLGKLELMGIPQIAIESEEYFNSTTEGDMSCRSFPSDQDGCYPGHPDMANCNSRSNGPQHAWVTHYAYPTQLFTSHSVDAASVTAAQTAINNANNAAISASLNPTAGNIAAANTAEATAILAHSTSTGPAIAAAAEFYDSAATKHLYSGVDSSNYQVFIKQIFKADEVVGCFPAGTTMSVGADANLCCTGFINSKTNKCQLQDFVDVSVYTNRYVSSEAKNLSANLFDQSGYVKDPSYVAQIACSKSMCASGVIAYGVLVSKLKTPGQESMNNKHFRFLEASAAADDANGILSLYNQGLKLNTHAYCLPAGTAGGEDLTVISCN